MPFTFHVKDDTTSGMEFVDQRGPLTQKERDFLTTTKETVLAHIESIEDRLARYQEYHCLNEEDFQLICESVAEKVVLENHSITLSDLAPIKSSETVIIVNMGHSKMVVARNEGGKVVEKREEDIASICHGHEVLASTLFSWVALSVKNLIKSGEKDVQVIFTTSHAFNTTDYSLKALSGGFYEAAASDKTFKLTSDDPIVNVPIMELVNHAFKTNDVSAKCVAVTPTSSIEHCATVELKHDPYAIICLNLSDGFHCSGTKFTPDGASVHKLDFGAVTIPANNIDQNYNFMQCRARGTNYLGRMASTESIAALTRMAWYHICQEKAPAVCWTEGALTTEDVLKVVYTPSATEEVLKKWLNTDVTPVDIERFQAVTKMITERNQTIIAAVIVGYGDKSGRVYDSFGTSKAMIAASAIADYPQFIEGIQSRVAESSNHGKIKVILNNRCDEIGTAVCAQNPKAFTLVKVER